MAHLLPRALAMCFATVLAQVAVAAPPERTLPVDPIELIAGREIPGNPELVVEHQGNAYVFSSATNKESFLKDPRRYEAADGGACGKMGALSGLGDARRYWVHAGRIYFFSSEGCRDGFKADPDAHIETDQPRPTGTPEQQAAGKATMERALARAGGRERFLALKSFKATSAREVTSRDTPYTMTKETLIVFPDRALSRDSWKEDWYQTAISPLGTVMSSPTKRYRAADSRGRAFARGLARWPVVILKAYAHAPFRDEPGGFIALGDGVGEIDGQKVEFVHVWLDGASSRLAIDANDGRLVQIAFRGRDGTQRVGMSERTFVAEETIDGICLPTSYTVRFNGAALEATGAAIRTIELDPAWDEAMFEAPAW